MSLLLPTTYYLLPTRRAQAVLSLVFLIGGIITFVSVTLAFITLSFINASSGFEKANRALAVAAAGTSDALLRLTRNKDFVSATPYTVPVDSFSASVTVAPNTPILGEATIVSAAIVSFYERRVQAVVSVTPSTGEVQVVSLGEITF